MVNPKIITNVAAGFDIGPASIGLSVINTTTKKHILDPTTRIFDAGVDLQSGKSRGIDRRNARSARKTKARRQNRKRRLRHIFKSKEFVEIDFRFDSEKDLVPLRAQALDEQIPFEELVRIFYFFAGSRGFKSNRKEDIQEDEKSLENKKVLKEISEIRKEMQELNARSIGEYLSFRNPREKRYKNTHFSRDQIEDEFNMIWHKQKEYYPNLLTKKNYDKIYNNIFYQRPMKSCKDLVGDCKYEKSNKRANKSSMHFQKFRILQTVGDTRIVNVSEGIDRELTDDEKQKLINHLNDFEKCSFTDARKLLDIEGKENKLNWQYENSVKTIYGNTTKARIIEAIGKDKWDELDDSQITDLISQIIGCDKNEILKKIAIKKWNMTEEQAIAITKVKLETGYSDLSSKALKKINIFMEKGYSYSTAVKEIYKDNKPVGQIVSKIGNVKNPRNPMVHRALCQVAIMINELIDAIGGIPEFFVVELSRDIKMSKKAKLQESIKNNANKKNNDLAKQELLDCGVTPTRHFIERVNLAIQQDWICQYTGKEITIQGIVSSDPLFEVDHIIPRSRCGMDGYGNKVLCCAKENRAKSNRTVFEFYKSDKKKYASIIKRFANLKGPYAQQKLKNARNRNVPTENAFINETVNATLHASQHISKQFAEIVAPLYGPDYRKHIRFTNGRVTAGMRRAFGLNQILSDGDSKNRDDHRHHALDSYMVALCHDVSLVREVTRKIHRGTNPFILDEPFDNFKEYVRRAIIRDTSITYRVNRETNRKLHEETIYGFWTDPKTGKKHTSLKKNLSKLSQSELGLTSSKGHLIIDKAAGDIIVEKYYELLDKMTKEKNKKPTHIQVMAAMAENENRPMHPNAKNKIRHVKVFQKVTPTKVGDGETTRYVKTGGNHHVEIFEHGKKWKAHVVTNLELAQGISKIKKDKKQSLPIIREEDEEGNPLIMYLSIGDILKLDHEGKRSKFVVQKISRSGNSITITVKYDNVARADKGINFSIGKFKEANPEKVKVPLINKGKQQETLTIEPPSDNALSQKSKKEVLI